MRRTAPKKVITNSGPDANHYSLDFDSMSNGYAYCRVHYKDRLPVDWTCLKANKAFETQTGLKGITGKKTSKAVPGLLESTPQLLETFGRVASTGIPEQFEIYVKSMDMWFSVSAFCPEKEHFIAVFDAITDRKRAEQRLKESEELLKAQFENSPDIIIVLDRNYRFVITNKIPVGFHSVKDAIGKDALLPLPEYLRDTIKNEIDLCFKTDIIRYFEHNDKDNNKYARARVVPLSTDGIINRVMIISTDITEMKLAEQRLKESEALLKIQFENSPDNIMVLDRDYRFLSTNTIPAGMHTAKDAIGKYVLQPFPMHVRETIKNEIDQCFKTGVIQDFEHKFVEGRYVRSRVVPLSTDGIIERVMIISTDITESKLAEEKLRSSERTLKRSQEIAHVASWSWDIRTRKITWSEEIFKILGMDRESITGDMEKAIQSAIHPDDRELVKERNRTALTGIILEPYEYRAIRTDGSIRHIWAEAADREFDSKGNVVKLSGIIQDITERRHSEEALEASELQYRSTLDAMSDAIHLVDEDLRILFINRAFMEWNEKLGIKIKGPGKRIFELFPFLPDKVRDEYDLVFEKGEMIITEEITRVAGMEIITETRKIPIIKNGKVSRVVTVIRDITENKKMIENIQRTDKLDALGILAGGIAHDFNNLLGGIYGYLQLAREECGTYTDALDYLDRALGSFSRAKDLTQQLLTFSRGGEPQRKTGRLEPVIRENTSFALSGSNIKSSLNIPGGLWLCDFDENQIAQLISNIVLNAQQAMPMGGEITITAENAVLKQENIFQLKEGGYIKISFRDTGIGIPAEILPRIFDPFFTTKQKGNGLGLATVYSIVKRHDGKITVESVQGIGTIFHIFLPASEKQAPEASTVKRTEHTGSGNILLMDDEESIRNIMGKMLSQMGYNVEYASDGREALEMISTKKESGSNYKMIFMDLTIPGGIGGRETIRKLRKLDSSVIAIVTSGYSEDHVMADPAYYGFDDKMTKPFMKTELAQLLNRHTEKKDD